MSDFVRSPLDDDERRRVEQAIAQGAGITIADFAEQVVGEPVDAEFVEILKSRLERAGANEEPFDLKEEIEKQWTWRQNMA